MSVFKNGGCLLNTLSINIYVNFGILSWDCSNGACTDPSTGNGTFTSLSDCILNCATTYINENELDNINIYPNPSTGILNLSFRLEKNQDLRIRILNVIGEEIVIDDLDQFTGNYNKQFGLIKYCKGIYFLEIKSESIIINKKFILS